MGWQDFVGKAMTRPETEGQIGRLVWTPKVWCPEAPQMPKGIVLHNTALPTLAMWAEAGANHDARIRNLRGWYEKTQRWKGGPHWFVSRDWINEFDGPLEHGTHSPSFNKTHFGIEMVGDFDKEAFDTGDGAKVRDNAVFLMAVLCRKFGWDPAKVIILHKEDPLTTHDCPGKNVHKADVITRVQAQMTQMGAAQPSAPTQEAPATQTPAVKSAAPPRNLGIIATVFGGHVDPGELSAYTGRVIDDVVLGVALPCRLVGNRPKVRVFNFNGAKSVVAEIVDVGPWNTVDAYWEAGKRPQSETGVDLRGRRTNRAGIDLTPALAKALGINGLGLVDWEFVPAA